ncbi:MAG: AIM24 family protein [Candidatus Saccharibacteria bacterium]
MGLFGSSGPKMSVTYPSEHEPCLELILPPGTSLLAAPETMVFMNQGVTMAVAANLNLGMPLVTFTNSGPTKAGIRLCSPYCGRIPWLSPEAYGGKITVMRKAFMCAGAGVTMAVENLIVPGDLQELSAIRAEGDDDVYLQSCGMYEDLKLENGQILTMDATRLMAWSSQMTCEFIQLPGIRASHQAGGDMLTAVLRGPGRIWLQNRPYPPWAPASD